MLDGNSRNSLQDAPRGFFSELGVALSAWGEICEELVSDIQSDNLKEIVKHYGRMSNVDGLLALGYVVRHFERTGDRLPQSKVIDELSARDSDDIASCALRAVKKTKDAVRMDIARRFKALAYFGLVERRVVTVTHVDLLPTEVGMKINARLNQLADSRKVIAS